MGSNDALTIEGSSSLQLESPRMSPRSQSPRVKRRSRTESASNKKQKKKRNLWHSVSKLLKKSHFTTMTTIAYFTGFKTFSVIFKHCTYLALVRLQSQNSNSLFVSTRVSKNSFFFF